MPGEVALPPIYLLGSSGASARDSNHSPDQVQALLEDGDEVLIPAPDYPLWTAATTLAGGKAVHYLCDEQNDWYPDIDDIRRKITPQTRAIVVINPNNPTGALYPVDLLQAIVDQSGEIAIIDHKDLDRVAGESLAAAQVSAVSTAFTKVTFSGVISLAKLPMTWPLRSIRYL